MFARYLHTSVRVMAGTHYDALRIHHSATAKDIKSAFKKLSLKLHPDILKSQDLSASDLENKNTQYLKIKKSYEVLSDPQAKSQYDIKIGHGRANAQTSEFLRRMNSFHYARSTSGNPFNNTDAPHFDSKKHYERNERMEQRFRKNMAEHSADMFGKNLYHWKMSGTGPKKDIYNNYRQDFRMNRSNDDLGGKVLLRFIFGVAFASVIWYLIKGTLATKRIQEENEMKRKIESDMIKGSKASGGPEANLSAKKKKLNVNNEYSKKLLQGAGVAVINNNNRNVSNSSNTASGNEITNPGENQGNFQKKNDSNNHYSSHNKTNNRQSEEQHVGLIGH